MSEDINEIPETYRGHSNMDNIVTSDMLEYCGSVHPNYPDLTCIRIGKCFLDDHIGIFVHEDGFHEIVSWGEDAENRAAHFGASY